MQGFLSETGEHWKGVSYGREQSRIAMKLFFRNKSNILRFNASRGPYQSPDWIAYRLVYIYKHEHQRLLRLVVLRGTPVSRAQDTEHQS